MSFENLLRAGDRGDRIPSAPFTFWLNQRLTRYTREAQGLREQPDSSPHPAVERLAQDLNVSERAVYRYLRGLNANGKPTDTFIRARVEDMLHAAGVGFHEVYPDLDPVMELEPDAWCRACGEMCTPLSGVCPWCSSRLDVNMDWDQAA